METRASRIGPLWQKSMSRRGPASCLSRADRGQPATVVAPAACPGPDISLGRPIRPRIRQAEYAAHRCWPHVPAHLQSDYLLVYVQEGHFLVEVSGATWRLEAGDFGFIQPEERVMLAGGPQTVAALARLDLFDEPVHACLGPCTLTGQVLLDRDCAALQPRLDEAVGVHIPVRFIPAYPDRFRDTLLRMIGFWQQSDPVNQLDAHVLATQLVAMLLRDHGQWPPAIATEPGSLAWVASHLAVHLAEPISVAALAHWAGLSPSHFFARFRRQFGCSPYRYLLLLRVDHAQNLLRTSALSHEQIATECGFADASHLSKTFRRLVGCSPSTFRQVASPAGCAATRKLSMMQGHARGE